MVAVASLIIILPMEDLNDWMFKIDRRIIYIIFKDPNLDVKYEDAKSSFETDYERENPVTKKEAIAAYIKSKLQKSKL